MIWTCILMVHVEALFHVAFQACAGLDAELRQVESAAGMHANALLSAVLRGYSPVQQAQEASRHKPQPTGPLARAQVDVPRCLPQ